MRGLLWRPISHFPATSSEEHHDDNIAPFGSCGFSGCRDTPVGLGATAGRGAQGAEADEGGGGKVVQIVGGDKAKIKSYCDIAALGEQLDAAAQKKDEKKMDELSQKVDGLSQTLGPEYVALMNGLDDVDPDSKDGKEIGTVLEGLDKLCDAK